MADPFVAEIRMFGCNFAPVGWAQCNGQLIPISQNTALFSLLGTQYGGNGQSNFALPDLQGSVPMGTGNGPGLTPRFTGETDGVSSVTLLQTQIPAHTHTARGSSVDGSLPSPQNNAWAGPGADRDLVMYNAATSGTLTAMAPTALSVVGGNQPHNNMMPYQCVNFCIAMQGVFPTRN